ncbi:hypothetical protein Zm00014a_027999 [Zea mays]|uniref:Uncharacterized protein n=1 Tax=Zea mays TaxID=4577 RepID=A0A3L6FPA2_MAIZE|nr:hypothetical protein Zm00014a_027999 [Zea mays]
MLGLAGDPALARLEMGRSVSYDDGLVLVRPAPASLPISRSRSDGGAVPSSATKPRWEGGRRAPPRPRPKGRRRRRPTRGV